MRQGPINRMLHAIYKYIAPVFAAQVLTGFTGLIVCFPESPVDCHFHGEEKDGS